VRERPILFRGELVREILAGRKTQTRRPVKPQPDFAAPTEGDLSALLERCPYGRPGDRLWVRETFCKLDREHWNDPRLPKFHLSTRYGTPRRNAVAYRAECDADSERCRKELGYRWTPSIHMPRWASRLTLDIVAVGLERLTRIVACDAEKEGVADVAAFAAKWDEIHGAGAFRGDPWVWVIQFRRVEEVTRAVA
jgi:hypothetical protein